MLRVRPFNGLRFGDAAGPLSTVLAPPYDVIDETDRAALLEQNRNNIVRVDLAADGYDAAAADWKRWQQDGIVRQDDVPAFYAYEQTYAGPGDEPYVRWGLTALVELADYDEGRVFPHEHTLSGPKADRLHLMEATGAQLSPVFGLHFGATTSIDDLLKQTCTDAPWLDVTDGDGVRHKVWPVTDADVIARISTALEPARIVIADGHHRYETALAYRNRRRAADGPGTSTEGPGGRTDAAWNYVMMVLVDIESPGLAVYPTHRLLHDVAGFTVEKLGDVLAHRFVLKPVGPGDDVVGDLLRGLDGLGDTPGFAVYVGDGRGWVCRLKDADAWVRDTPSRIQAWRDLDVSVLHGLALEGLGVDAAAQAAGGHLTYVQSAQDAASVVDEGRGQAAFYVRPTPSSTVRDVAVAGQNLPQKSTYYYPKLLTGFVMSGLDSRIRV